jgi:D-amino peptidase
MRVFISADMEGISSVAGLPDVTPGSPEHEVACHWMTQDVNAAVEGAMLAGAEQILVNDGHWDSRNIVTDELDSRAELVRGYVKPLGMMEGVDRGWDAAFFIGYHVRFGVFDGVMGHTLSGECFRDVRLNGRSVGEAELNAAVAGHFGVPVVLISGDHALERETVSVLPTVRFVVVKTGLQRETAALIHPSVTQQEIREAARASLGSLPGAEPFRVGPPCEVEVEFQRPESASIASSVPGVSRVGGCDVHFDCADAPAALRILKVLLRLGG